MRALKVATAAALVLALVQVVPGDAKQRAGYGDPVFPKDEHQHIDGWDYWWGAADLVTESGNQYTVGFAFDSFYGAGASGEVVFPQQGPYKGKSILTMDGPAEWGHPGEQQGEFLHLISNYIPKISERVSYRVLDTLGGLKEISSLQRITLDRFAYRMRIDNKAARVHPSGQLVRWAMDLDIDMQGPPLLAGGTGNWWYGLPDVFGYPSRSFQYMQAAKTLTGTLDLEQPNGALLRETVVPGASSLVLIREYDATPEDLFAGLALAESTQLHLRYPQYYMSGMPWELVFVDLKNGAQLMVSVLAFHETENGLVTPLIGKRMPTYRVLGTLRMPDGTSVALDDVLHVEHLSYREIVGNVPTFAIQFKGIWTQAWEFRVSYPGGTVTAPNGKPVEVPPFDLGVVPMLAKNEPALDEEGNGLTQRVPFRADGSYNGCPVHGFGWSELIINWYGYDDQDPFFTGGPVPTVPETCGEPLPTPPAGNGDDLKPPRDPFRPPDIRFEGCQAFNPGRTRREYDATIAGGVFGVGDPGGWRVTITRPGRSTPLVINGQGASNLYACGAVRLGDHVVVEALKPFSGATAGNPGICF